MWETATSSQLFPVDGLLKLEGKVGAGNSPLISDAMKKIRTDIVQVPRFAVEKTVADLHLCFGFRVIRVFEHQDDLLRPVSMGVVTLQAGVQRGYMHFKSLAHDRGLLKVRPYAAAVVLPER